MNKTDFYIKIFVAIILLFFALVNLVSLFNSKVMFFNRNYMPGKHHYAMHCNTDFGYTEIIKNEKTGYWECYNPNTQLSYSRKDFYYKGEYCGSECDIGGLNCKIGICDINSCNQELGYTEIKDGKCYNPSTGESYGNKCPYGHSYPTDCDRKQGYTIIKDCKCYNPDLKLSYEKRIINKVIYPLAFYYNDHHCGDGCDKDGRNCKNGFCNVLDCDQEHGFTEINEYGYCHNPKTNESYYIYEGKRKYMFFNKKGEICGVNCDKN